MSARELKKKPLIEAICEIRWALKRVQGVPGMPEMTSTDPLFPVMTVDPHYRLLLGRLYDRLRSQYATHEPLGPAGIPDEMSGHIVQHRFRAAQNEWPLIQMGPGVVTINDTSKYNWEDFRGRVVDVKTKLYEAHPEPQDLRIETLVLRYLDAVEFDYPSADVFQFLSEKLKVSIALSDDLFVGTGVEQQPCHFQSQQMHRTKTPAGIFRLGFATGIHNGKPSLIWETSLSSTGEDVSRMPDDFETWLDQAHTLISDWFFKMIDGDLRRRFSGE